MFASMITVYVLLGCVAAAVVLFMVFMGLYNSLVRLRSATQDSWSQIDVQLKRRHDLIPNLVETVKGYMRHERETLENVTKARQLAQHAQGVADRASAEQGLSAALGRLIAVAESYPDLKANQNFLSLQEEITATENRIGFARQFYNDCVMRLNNKVLMVPSNIVAALFNFKQAEYFQLEEPGERQTPEVRFP